MIAIGAACLSAIGDEIGWRGFPWPLARRRLTSIPATLDVTTA